MEPRRASTSEFPIQFSNSQDATSFARHCERKRSNPSSVPRSRKLDCFVAFRLLLLNYGGQIAPRNDRKSTCVLAARSARAVDDSLAPNEGVGNAGCPLHPRPRVQLV